jgi:NAD(P)-dependent dehydrogenase (short-subunit alcohol dehydrogenase family)
VLVTGAALRLGRAIALDLAKHGWRIGVHHHTSGAEAQSLVEEIERLGSKAVALPADLTREDQLRGLVQSCAEELGPPTCLINNAARFEWDSIDTLDWAAWQAELDVNLRAPIFLTQAFARTLPKDAHGCVINMIDQRVWRLTPEFFSYTIAKSALWTATRTLAQALAPRIRVNAIGPGPVLPSLRQSQADFARDSAWPRRHNGGGVPRRALSARQPLGDRTDDRARQRPAPCLGWPSWGKTSS